MEIENKNQSIEKNNEANQRDLLNKLSEEISKNYWLEKQNSEELVKLDTSRWIENLKKELLESGKEYFDRLKTREQEKLFLILKWAQEVTEKNVQLEIMTLKSDIEQNINIEDIKNNIESYLPDRLISTAKNPKMLHEHILGFALWTSNSLIAWLEWLYNIWKWIIQTPYHIYLIVKWEWEIKNIKNI